MISTKPAYCGWRMRAYGPEVASRCERCAQYSTLQAAASSKNPATRNTVLSRWNGPKCGLPRQPNATSSRWPESCANQSTPGKRTESQPERK